VTRALTVMQLLPALDSGGVERSTIEIAQALGDAGHRAIVVSAGGRLLPELAATGAQHIELPIGRKSLATLRHVLSLRALIRRHRPDIVHARSRLPAWLGWAAVRSLPRTLRPHLVTTVHGLNSVGRYSAIMTRGEKVIAVSRTVRDHLRKHYRVAADRIEVIPRGIDPVCWPRDHRPDDAWRSGFLRACPQLADRRLLVVPARGTRLKGHAEAIHLLAALVSRGHDVALALVGADEPGRERYLAELRSLATDLDVAGRIAITPPRNDIREVMAIADIVLQLSAKPESFGRTVIEALSLGRPVLGWDRGGVGELLRELYPVGVAPADDREQLAEQAASILAQPIPVRHFDGYTLAAMQQRTLAVYGSIVDVEFA
jgi:glycosyltransferase involved in cell wall biosynthesis